jgi:phosphate transport system substrate-binding protein
MIKQLSLPGLVLIASSTMFLAGCCGSKSNNPDSTANAGTSASNALTGAGSTFIYPLASKWFSEYGKLHAGVQVNYQSIGSGGGIKQVTEGTVDFGATDGPMKDEQLAEFRQKRGCEALHFPAAMGGVVPIYNLPGVNASLHFTPQALAGIFLGTIVKWNDPAIASANKGVKLPNSDIVVVHRSDGSGTTYTFVDYLSKVSPVWKEKTGVGTSVNWPVGLGGKGNEGVSGQVKQIPNSIGYVELIYATRNNIAYGAVENSAGTFVKADLASVTAAAASAVANMPQDFRVSITNAPGPDAYPISTFTWLLIPSKISDPNKKSILVGFLKWMLTDGQSFTEPLSYAPIPKEIQAMELQAISKIQ